MRRCFLNLVIGLLTLLPSTATAQYDTMHFVAAPFGYLTWEKVPVGVVPLREGGYFSMEWLVVDYPLGYMLMSLHDSLGNIVYYDSVFSDTTWVFTSAGQLGFQTLNGDVVVWGWQADTSLQKRGGYIRRMKENGTLVWHREYLPEDTLLGGIQRVLELPGGYLLATGQAGDSTADPSPDGWILMTDSLGNKLWELFYDGVMYGGINDVLYDGSGHAYAFYLENTGPYDHDYGSTPLDLTLLKINTVTGMFEEIIPVNMTDDYDQPAFFNWDYDSSRFIATGTHFPVAVGTVHKPRPFMLAVDTAGIIDWEYREPYNGVFSSFIFSSRAVIRQPGRYVVSGDCQSLVSGPGYGINMRTMCIDSSGYAYWESYFNVPPSTGCSMTNRPDWPGGFAPTEDGGYVAAVRVIMSCESCLPGQPPLWMIPNQTTTLLVKMDSVGCYTTYCGSIPVELPNPGLAAYFSAPYPNPANEWVHIALPENANGKVSRVECLHLLSGQVIYAADMSGPEVLDIPCATWPSGTYVVRIIQESTRVAHYKLMVNH